MPKKSLFLLMIMMIIPFLMKAEWKSINKNKSSQTPPNVTLISDDNNSTVLKIEILGFDLKDLYTNGSNYQVADLLTESFVTKPGFPALPYIAKVLAIPDQASVSVEILETGDIQTFQNIYLPPARTSWFEGDPETPYIENMEAYSSNKMYPNEFVEVDPPSIFRDFRIARVSVFPMRYIPTKKELQVVTSLTVRINYGPGKAVNPKTSPKKSIAPSFGQLYQNFIFNYQSVLDESYGGKEKGHELMLCIMPDDFYDGFQTYAEWKRQSGIDIHITKFSDIGANSSNEVIIKDHISDAYYNWEIAPTYLLIVGDDGVFPWTTANGYVSENYFVEIDGNDYFPEMMLGRFTNQSDYQMQVMINKFIKYEKTPYTTSIDWFKKGICCSNDAYASQVATKRFAAERMLIDGGFTSVDTMMDANPCNYYLSDAISAINYGRSFLNYRGEGWSSGWWAGCVGMGTSDVSNLSNGEKFTFVTSIGCGVAMFTTSGGNCFGEEWIELGTLSSPRGAAAFMGPCGNTHTTYNNKIDKGIYVGMFQEGLSTAGQGLLRGKLYLYNVYGTDPNVSYHYKIFCILGDPSIHAWKDVPLDVTVDYPSSIVFGSTLVEFTVTHTGSSLPVENAVVCVTGNDVFASGVTASNGKVYLEITAGDPETLTVTVTGGNVYPFQGPLMVIPPVGPWVIKDYYILDDNAGGNGNNLMDYGESIFLSLALENIGTVDATNLIAELSTSDPYITFTNDFHNYGSIPAGQSILANNAFSFTVANNIPDQHTVLINVQVSSISGIDVWNSYFSIIGHAPVLSTGTLTISDPGGNNNGLLDPGETATIIIPISNNGSSISPDATANLSSTSSYITLNNISENLGPIDISETVDASYSVTVSPSAPQGESIDLDLDVIAADYSVSKSFMTSVGLMLEDWETGDFNRLPWTMGGNADWTLVTDNPYEGIYCTRSGYISHSQISDLEVTLSVTGYGNITFYRKVSSEGNYDYLRFFIDGSMMADWSGNIAWGQVSFPVSAGVHTFKWQYYKDNSVNSGEDCAWIDYIAFPYPEVPPYYMTDFEEGGALPDGWYNDVGDDFDWTVLSGPTPTRATYGSTGAQGDHTTGGGYYVYTESSSPNYPDKRADLISPTFDLSNLGDVEVKFWYHMYNNSSGAPIMGDLHLDVFHNNVWIEDVMTPISGNQGDQWLVQIVDLSAYDGEIITLRFRGITGGYASDICIDDFSITGNPVSADLTVDLTVFLEGPCTGTEMSTYLCACSTIPLTQPFNTAPWNYNGTETVSVMPGNSVDWVLVELRDATSAANATQATAIDRQAGLLFSDGTILATDGYSPLSFTNTISNGLFAVVYHRNHLAIMSANAVTLIGDNYTYDFTTASEQAHGGNAQNQLSADIWGMKSGDTDANGTVENEDNNPAWSTIAGKAGYFPADLNLDQQVNNIDKDDFWMPNMGQGTNVPE